VLLYTKFHQSWVTRSASRRPQLQNVQCAFARQRSLPWQPQHGGHVENVLGCDHPSCVPVGPLVGELWHFEYFLTWRPSAILKILIFNHEAIIVVINCCCVPNLIKIDSCVRPPDAYSCILHNVQRAVARQRTLPWQPQYGGHVVNMMGCDHPSCVPVGPLVGELWHFEYFLTWRPSAILNFKNFNI